MNTIALDFIKAREGCRLVAYQDSGGKWTCGDGATGPKISRGTVWTQGEADADLARRVAVLETSVSLKTASVRLGVQQSAALILLAYNIGFYAFSTSHALAFVLARNWIAAVKAMLEWDHVAGAESQGLLKRRLEEARAVSGRLGLSAHVELKARHPQK